MHKIQASKVAPQVAAMQLLSENIFVTILSSTRLQGFQCHDHYLSLHTYTLLHTHTHIYIYICVCMYMYNIYIYMYMFNIF